MTDLISALADQILALVNSKPSTPTKEEIKEAIIKTTPADRSCLSWCPQCGDQALAIYHPPDASEWDAMPCLCVACGFLTYPKATNEGECLGWGYMIPPIRWGSVADGKDLNTGVENILNLADTNEVRGREHVPFCPAHFDGHHVWTRVANCPEMRCDCGATKLDRHEHLYRYRPVGSHILFCECGKPKPD
jgi:hypothetical protein